MSDHNVPTNDSKFEVAIIGAGPIGIELAAGLRTTGVKSLAHFDAGPIGSTIMWWAPETRFFSSPERIAICGIPISTIDQTKLTREEYLAYLRAVVAQFDLEVRTYRRVTSIQRSAHDDGFELKVQPSPHGVGGPDELQRRTESETESHDAELIRAKRMVLAIGDMHRPRMLNIPGEDLPHVSHYLREVHSYFRKRVVIVGGKNSAVEAAIRLYRAGAHVTMVYRGNEFDPKRVKYWLKPELEWLILKKKIAFHPNCEVTRIDSKDVSIRRGTDNNEAVPSLPADFVLLLTGYEQDPTLFMQLGVELQGDERAPTFDRSTMETNVPGVYVAGTAAGGTQPRARFYIENTHVHVERIVRAITGSELPWQTDATYADLEES